MSVQISVDEDSLLSFLRMQSASLLDIDRNQPGNGNDQHSNETCQLPHDDGEYDESYEGKSDCSCCEGQESSTNPHEFKRFLKSLENRVAHIVDFHK